MPSRQQMPASLGTLWILFSGNTVNFIVIFNCVFLIGKKMNSMVRFQNLIPMWGNSWNLIFHFPQLNFKKIHVCFFLLTWTILIILHVNFMYHWPKSIPIVKKSCESIFFRGDPSEGVSSDKSLKRNYRLELLHT